MIYDLAVALRVFYSGRLEAAGRPAFERQHTSDGAVAFDGCETLSVECPAVRTGTVVDADNRPVGDGTQLVADFRVWAVRCVPVVDDDGPPSVADVEASAARILGDRWVLATATLELATAADSPLARCSSYRVVDIAGVGPDGGIAGTVVSLSLSP